MSTTAIRTMGQATHVVARMLSRGDWTEVRMSPVLGGTLWVVEGRRGGYHWTFTTEEEFAMWDRRHPPDAQPAKVCPSPFDLVAMIDDPRLTKEQLEGARNFYLGCGWSDVGDWDRAVRHQLDAERDGLLWLALKAAAESEG